MLHNNFIVCIMTCSVFAVLLMLARDDLEYIIIPIGVIIWGLFKFFDDNDRKYLRSRGIDPDEFDAFFLDYYDNTYSNSHHHRTYDSHTSGVRSGNTITWDSPSDVRRESPMYGGRTDSYYETRRYQNPVYKGLVKKCKRNFKITVDKEIKNESRKGILHRIASIE